MRVNEVGFLKRIYILLITQKSRVSEFITMLILAQDPMRDMQSTLKICALNLSRDLIYDVKVYLRLEFVIVDKK